MKTNWIILLITISQYITSQNITINNIQQVSNSTIELQHPKFSPDGTKLLATGERKTGLYVIHLDSLNAITQINNYNGAGIKFNWNKNGDIQYQSKSAIQNISINGKPQLKSAYSANDTTVYIDKELKLRAQITNTSTEWIITQSEDSFYNPIPSPNKKKIAVNSGAQIWIYPIEGALSGINLGDGIVSSWSPDGRYILAFMDESEDGASVSNSDFFIIDIQTGKRTILTHSTTQFEMWPALSPDGKKIVYSDAKSGQLFIADINLNQ